MNIRVSNGITLILCLILEGGDYNQLITTIYFRPDGPSYAEVRIAILNDLLPESDEHFVVELSTFDISVILVNKVAEIWIIDDESK